MTTKSLPSIPSRPARYALALLFCTELLVSTLSAQTPAAALDFDGVNDYVNAGNVTATNFGTAYFSIEFWVKTSQVSAVNSYIISKRSICNPSNFWNINLRPNGSVRWESMQTGFANYVVLESTMPINDGVWRHLAFAR